MKTIEDVKFYKYEAEVELKDRQVLSFGWDGKYDVTEEDIIEWMNGNCIDQKSIDLWVSSFVRNFQLEEAAE